MQLIGDLDSEPSPLGQPVADGLEKNVGGAVETERRPDFHSSLSQHIQKEEK